MLTVSGRPIELDEHLTRIDASTSALYDLRGSGLRERILAAVPAGLSRLRLTVRPSDSARTLVADVVSATVEMAIIFPGPELGMRMHTAPVELGWGDHKWADRSGLEPLEAMGEEGSVPLLLTDGSVLEGSRANVFAVFGGEVVTPPLDGQILPGVARARVIELARAAGMRVSERTLALTDLLAAEEVFLTGSVRGVEPVVAVDGHRLGAPLNGVTASLAAALRRHWAFP
jgi:para-aminobenzoate synthetase / 4-amino-4-deoxychorismate lyase